MRSSAGGIARVRLHADVVEHERGSASSSEKTANRSREVAEGDGLVERDARRRVGGSARRLIRRAAARRSSSARAGRSGTSTRSVSKNASCTTSIAEPPEPVGQQAASGHAPARAIRRRPSRAVVHGVHARHHREQHLRRADVARRLVAADVLLARLERQPVARACRGVARDADDPAGHLRACTRPCVAKYAACGPP